MNRQPAPQSTLGSIVSSLAGMARGAISRPEGFTRSHSRDASWARGRQLDPLHAEPGTPGRLVLGHVAGAGRFRRKRLLATEQRHSVLVVGPTQTMKTTGLAVPALLEWRGPIVAASVKNDLVEATLSWRKGRGVTWIFDPASSTRYGGEGWSPLSECADWVGARRTASSLASQGTTTGLQDGEFWHAAAAKLIAPHLFAASTAGLCMADVVEWIDTREQDEVEEILLRSGCREALNAASASFNREDRQLSSIYTTAETILESFADPEVGRVGPGRGFDVHRLLDGGEHSLFLCSPAHEQARLRPLFSALVDQVVNAAYDKATSTGGPLDPPLLLVVDEAANIAPLSALDALASTAASHGIQLVTVWQDFAQIRARYGERAPTVINNHRAKVFLSGVSDLPTLDYVQRIAGEGRTTDSSFTRDPKGGRSVTWQSAREALLTPDRLRRVPPGEGIVVYGHLPPVRIELRPWFAHDDLRARVDAPAEEEPGEG